MHNTNLLRGRSAIAVFLTILLTACGGGGGNSGNVANTEPNNVPITPTPVAEPYQDSVSYSANASAVLSSAVEGAARTQHSIALRDGVVAYTATAGHLTASAPQTNAAEASFFYVAYTANNQPKKNRPVTFFYNGGPGTDTVWLHLGSFGPKRLATGFPSLDLNGQFALVDNAESLLNVSDLVFINAIGTGYSQAIAPNTNASFWNTDGDAALFRDFVQRYIAANGRQESPKYLFGESYGGIRSGILASLLEAAGVHLDGVILQSPSMNMNYVCAPPLISQCGSHLPSLAATAQYFKLAPNGNSNLPSYMQQMREFNANQFSPALYQLYEQQTPVSTSLAASLSGYAGLSASEWLSAPDMFISDYRTALKPGSMVGRLDSRVVVPNSSPLATDDPSFDYIKPGFANAISGYLRDTLKYTNSSTYVVGSKAGETWRFQHGGQQFPDVIPDLGAAMRINPNLRVLNMNGYYDLATPFHANELDLARLDTAANRIYIRNYPSGHMSYLDDKVRILQYADLVAFYRNSLTAKQYDYAALPPSALPPLATSGLAIRAKQSVPAGAFLATQPVELRATRASGAIAPSQGADLQKEIEGRLRQQFERASGGNVAGATREQLQAAGLGHLVAHFNEIDRHQRGRISFQDWMNYLQRKN
ncbi:MAG: peptidase S10 [Burkholderiales bacterium]|nr:peptidase S10 [Burkholderiales bacterium]